MLTCPVIFDKHCNIVFMLTAPCLRHTSANPCDPTVFGQQALNSSDYDHVDSETVLYWSKPGTIITKNINYASFVSHLADPPLPKSISKKIYLYCAPCSCQIASALKVIFSEAPGYLWMPFSVRIDYRLQATCCAENEAKRVNSCISFLKYIKMAKNRQEIFKFVDTGWLDQAIYHYTRNSPQPISPPEILATILKTHQSERDIMAIIILGETDYTIPMMNAPPFPQPDPSDSPQDSQIHMLSQVPVQGSSGEIMQWHRRYIGSFVPTFQE